MPKLLSKNKLGKDLSEAELKELLAEMRGKTGKKVVKKEASSTPTKRGTSRTRKQNEYDNDNSPVMINTNRRVSVESRRTVVNKVDKTFGKSKKKIDKQLLEYDNEKAYVYRKLADVKKELETTLPRTRRRNALLTQQKDLRIRLSKAIKRKQVRVEAQVKKVDEYALQVIKETQLQMYKKSDGVLDRVYTVNPYPVTESTVKHLSHEIYKLVSKQISEVKRNNRGGYKVYIKAYMTAENSKASAVVNAANLDGSDLEDAIYNELSKRSNKHYPTENYILYLEEVSVFVSGLGDSGGCHDGKTVMKKIKLDKDVMLKLINHKSKGNNCLIQCFNHSYSVNGNSMKGSTVRKDLGLKEGEMIVIDMIPKLSAYYNEKCNQELGYVVMNEHNEIILFKHPFGKERETEEELYNDGHLLVRIYLANEHYYSYDMIIHYRCENCGARVTSESNHHCSRDAASYYHRMIKGDKNGVVSSFKIKKEGKLDYNSVVHFDLETFQPADGVRHEVYASAYHAEGKYTVYYGQKSMDKMVDDFMKFENKIVNAYNGSGFDFYFLINMLVQKGAIVEDIIINGGKVMKFFYRTEEMEKKDRNCVFDLYLFTMTALSKACEDFKLDHVKGNFDHTKMKSWDDVEKYKDEVYPYLKLDVLAPMELFTSFNDMIYKIKSINITDFITASHMGYNIWQNELKEVVEIPDSMDKLKFIRHATHGGRCYPHQQRYQSVMYDEIKLKEKECQMIVKPFDVEIKEKKEVYEQAVKEKAKDLKQKEEAFKEAEKMKVDDEDIIKLTKEKVEMYKRLVKSKDFMFNADASSLYPASMAGFEHMKVEYPIGKSRWSDEPKKEFDANKIGFYEISYIPPKDIRIPILPRSKLNKGVKIGVEWSLHDGVGIFTSVDILNAIESGYKVTFINKCLVYDQKGDVFSNYIHTFYKLKGEAEKEGNDCLRSIAKLLLNSLYGKMLMSPIISSSKIINNAIELHKFFREYDLTDYHALSDKRLLVTGSIKKENQDAKITKPSQLGAFCLGYSRRIMLFYMKEVDPTLKSLIFTYTDTDSLHISGEAWAKLHEKGLIKSKKDATLGFLCSDISNEGLILKEVNLAPKTYMYEYLNEKGGYGETKKCKGIPQRELKKLTYEKYNEPCKFDSLQKKIKLTKSDVEKGVGHFSVVKVTQTRTFMKTQWSGMALVDNQYFPQGYKF